MKRQIFITVAFMTTMSIIEQAHAQEAVAAKTASYDLKKAVKCRIMSTGNGCDIDFYEVKSPRDVATGQSSGKRQHKPIRFTVSSGDNSIMAVKSPRDMSTGQASGKVSYSDLSVMISLEKSKAKKLQVENGEFELPSGSPDGDHNLVLSWSWGESNAGHSKRCRVSFTVTMQDGVCIAIKEQGIK